eukprot:COSAG06_NODE_12448_length_1380_cov_1.916472_3_plen_28_part_01
MESTLFRRFFQDLPYSRVHLYDHTPTQV